MDHTQDVLGVILGNIYLKQFHKQFKMSIWEINAPFKDKGAPRTFECR